MEGVEAASHVVVLIRRMVRILDGREVGLVVDGVGTSLVFHLGDGGAGVVHVETVAFACQAGSATVITLLVVRGLGLLGVWRRGGRRGPRPVIPARRRIGAVCLIQVRVISNYQYRYRYKPGHNEHDCACGKLTRPVRDPHANDHDRDSSDQDSSLCRVPDQ